MENSEKIIEVKLDNKQRVYANCFFSHNLLIELVFIVFFRGVSSPLGTV